MLTHDPTRTLRGAASSRSPFSKRGEALVFQGFVRTIPTSRVLFGLGNQGSLPALFARVDARTRTPLFSTLVVMATILALALALPLQALAEMKSSVVLCVFVLINLALIRTKLTGEPTRKGFFAVPIWVPMAGTLSCLAMLTSGLL